jgi:hypothetical protein
VPLGQDATPPGLAEAELRARLRSREKDRARYAPDVAPPKGQEAHFRRGWAGMPFSFGHLQAALGDYAGAKAAFGECARLLSDVLRRHPDPQSYVSALQSAILAGLPDLARHIAQDRETMRGELRAVPDAEGFQRALPLLVLGLDDEARPWIEKAKAVVPEKAWRRGMGALLGALAEKDADAFGRASEEMLAHHHASANHKGSETWNSEHSFLCAPAISLSILARGRGMSIPEPPSRRATLKNLLSVYLTEFEGRPLEKGTTFDLAVDYLPDALG